MAYGLLLSTLRDSLSVREVPDFEEIIDLQFPTADCWKVDKAFFFRVALDASYPLVTLIIVPFAFL